MTSSLVAMTVMTCGPSYLSRATAVPGRLAGHPLFPIRDVLIAAWLVLAATAVVYADELRQDWMPEGLTLPEDAEVVTDRAIGSTVRMFSISTRADIDELLAVWEESLGSSGYSVTQGADDLLKRSIEFSGAGIANAKIIVAPTTSDGRGLIEFDATLR